MRRRHIATSRWVAAIALCGAAVGCQSHSGADTNSAPPGPGSLNETAKQAAKAIDACSMISPQDISTLLGVPAAGKRRGSNCSWENSSTDESVTLEIGLPDSASHNTLRKRAPGMEDMFKPGPDGMLYGGVDGAVIFPAGNRENQVQVAVLRLEPAQRNSAAVDLARKIGPKVPG